MNKDWEEKKLEDLADTKKAIVSGPFGSNLKVSDYRDSGVPILRLQNIGKGKFIEKDIKYIGKEKAEELKSHSFVVGDIVLAKLGIPIGKTCIIPETFEDGIILADLVRIRPDKRIVNYKYLEYFLNTDLSVSQLTKEISGATRPRVNLSNVRNIVVPIPSLKIQNNIIKILDKAFESIEQAKANIEKNIENTKELFQSRLNEIFFQKGDGWEEKEVGKVCKTGAGGTPLKSRKEYYENGNISWLCSGEVKQGNIYSSNKYITKKGLDNSSAKLFPKNTVVIAMYGATAGDVGILRFETSTNQAVCGILPNELFLPEFIYYSFSYRKNELIAQATGNAQPNISQIKIKNTLIPIIEKKEQIKIVQELDKLKEQTKQLENHYKQKLKNLEELKKSILQKAFSGELLK
jgi:type I restriction enzyme S subunit